MKGGDGGLAASEEALALQPEEKGSVVKKKKAERKMRSRRTRGAGVGVDAAQPIRGSG